MRLTQKEEVHSYKFQSGIALCSLFKTRGPPHSIENRISCSELGLPDEGHAVAHARPWYRQMGTCGFSLRF